MRRLIPLKLAYAKSIHTFQGQSAGPTEPGRPRNAVQRIICDAGSSSFENLCPGLLYSLLSRATTLGTTLNALDSAIYFTGNFSENRVLNMGRKKDGTLYKIVAMRDIWVQQLKQYTVKSTLANKDRHKLLSWMKQTRYKPDFLIKLIESSSWRQHKGVNY